MLRDGERAVRRMADRAAADHPARIGPIEQPSDQRRAHAQRQRFHREEQRDLLATPSELVHQRRQEDSEGVVRSDDKEQCGEEAGDWSANRDVEPRSFRLPGAPLRC